MGAASWNLRGRWVLVVFLCAVVFLQIAVAARVNLWADDLPILADVRLAPAGIWVDFQVQSNGFWRPATRLVFRGANSVWGTAPFYGILSVLIHVLNAGLVLAVSRSKRLFAMEWEPALVAALLFLAGFAWSEAVIMLPASGDKFLVTVILAGLLWGGTPARDAAFTVLCLMAKDNGFIFPAIALARDVFLRGKDPREAVFGQVPAGVIAASYAVWLVWRVQNLGGSLELSSTDRSGFGAATIMLVLNQWAALFAYGPLDTNCNGLFWLRPLRGVRWTLRLGTVAIALLAVVAISRTERGTPTRRGFFLAAWAALALLTISLRSGGVVSRYLYDLAPCWALLLPLGWVAIRERTGAPARLAVVIALHCWLAFQIADWAMSPMTKYATTIPNEVRVQMEALRGPLSEEARHGTIVVLSGTAFREESERHEKLIQAYVGILYPEARVLVRLLDRFPVGAEQEEVSGVPTEDFTWNSGRGIWEIRKRGEQEAAEKP